MSYIDDLNQAATEALAASSSATDSAQIMFDVANGGETTTVTTANGEVKTLAKAIKDIIDSIEAGVEAPQVEPQTLSAGQTTVSLTTMTTEGIAVYVEGSREFDFTVVNSTDFEFGESFPDGTRVWIVKRDIEGTADSFTVNTSTGTQTLSDSLDNRVIYVNTIADLQALPTSELVDGQVVRVSRVGEYVWDAVSQHWALLGERVSRINQPQRSGNLAVRGGLKADYNPGRPLVSFIDDDAHERVYTYLYPILVDKGIPFGLAVPSNKLDTSGKLTLAQLCEIVSTTGSEVLSHTYDEKGLVSGGLSDAEIEFELRESKKQLESYGFVVDGFVPVGGQDSVSIRALIDEYYAASYVTQGANNALPFINELSVRRQQFAATSNGGDTLQYYKDIVDQAVANNEWVVFTTHVGIVPAYQDANHDAWLPELIDYIQSLGVEIVAPRDGLAEFGQVIRQERASEGAYFRLDKSGRLQSSDVDAKYFEYDDSRAFDAGLDEYPRMRATVAVYNDAELPSPDSPRGTLITHRPSDLTARTEYGWQEWRPGLASKSAWARAWLQDSALGTGTWGEWQRQAPHAGSQLAVTDTPADIRAKVGDGITLVTASYNGAEASAAGLPTYGYLVTRLGGSGRDYNTSQTFYAHDDGEVYNRWWDSGAAAWTDWLAEKIIKRKTILDFGSVAAQSTKSVTVSVAGVILGSNVTVNLQSPAGSGVVITANSYSNGIVTVEATNVTAAAVSVGTRDIYLKIDRVRA